VTARRIAVVTGTRADYGLLRWLMAEIAAQSGSRLQVVVTGMHLSPEFGNTWRAIEDDGFTIDERVEMLLASDSPVGVAKSTGIGTMGLADAFARLSPDIVVLLGDRFEILAAAQAALMMRIPIAHIAGGESTEGAIDDAIRHAITKMSKLHFTAAEPYRDRVIQMGEQPRTVFQVGAIGLDNLERLPLLDRHELSDALGFDLGTEPLVVSTFHPETLAGETPDIALAPLFEALAARPDLRIVFTKGNADSGGHEMNRLVDEFVAAHADRTIAFTSLGQLKYLSLLTVSDLVIGNSSSGIVEAPAAGTPTVNIGDRQKGRLRAPSVIDVPGDADSIGAAIDRALSADFRELAAKRVSPFGSPGASAAIAKILADVDLGSVRKKTFYTPAMETHDDHA
jgi:UDP-hydrolysing UDP-N-acetyl-D-glucosamine 2-epimerase